MRKALLFTSFLLLISCTSELDIPSMANVDDAWVKTYRGIAVELNQQVMGNRPQPKLIAESLDLPESSVRNLLRFATNYTKERFSINKVQYRYAHYNTDSLKADMESLVKVGLARPANVTDVYKVTLLGRNVLTKYWILRLDKVYAFEGLSNENINTLYQVLSKLVEAAMNLEDGFNNESIQIRIKSRSPDFIAFPPLLKVLELVSEYTAFINDNAHYKYDYFISQSDDPKLARLKLSPLAKELMSATRNGRVYDLERCYNQSYWRVGKKGCDMAVDELVDHGLVIKGDGSITQSNDGATLSAAVEKFADQRLYKTWAVLTSDEYHSYMEVLDLILGTTEN